MQEQIQSQKALTSYCTWFVLYFWMYSMECVFLMMNHVEDRRTFKINSHSLLKTSQNTVDMGLPQRYTLLHYTTLHYATPRYTTLHYATLQLHLQPHLQLHYFTLHYTTLQYATLLYTTLRCTSYTTPKLQLKPRYTNYATLQLQFHYTTTKATTALHRTTSSRCGWGDHCNHCNRFKKQLQPPFGPSVDSLCHPCITTTRLSYSVVPLKLSPSPCAVLLV